MIAAVPGLLKITFESNVDGGGAVDEVISDTVGDADGDPVCQTQCQADQRRWRFPAHVRHFEWTGARVLVFTDKEQDTPEVVEITASDPREHYDRG